MYIICTFKDQRCLLSNVHIIAIVARVVIVAREGVQLNRVNTLGEYTTFEYICGLVQVHGSTINITLVYRSGAW